MTTEVLFDTWAWWEVLARSAVGKRITARYEDSQIHTSAWALGELAAKLHAMGRADRMGQVAAVVQARGRIIEVDADLAIVGASLRVELRRKDGHASLGDGVMLATARRLGVKLVSGDGAFAGQKDVVSV